MKTVTIYIDCCAGCPYCDSGFPTPDGGWSAQQCRATRREFGEHNWLREIPDWCPMKDKT